MSSDDRLAQRAAQGNQRALAEIYRRYSQDLYRFCLAMVGNPQDAQDALQNTMVKVLRSLPGEERKIELKPWLYRIARNESIETLRKRRDSAELEPQQAATIGVTETAEARERLRTLLADLDQLPERQRSALVMRELSGLDFEQIGGAFGTSAAVARQTLYEARLSLRQMEAGREMRCAEVTRELSDADGRVTRRREIRSHLRSCPDCRAFRDGIGRRHEDLTALAPLPIAASASLLQGLLGKGAASGSGPIGGGLGGAIGTGAGKAITTSAIVKSAATVAVVAAIGVSAADRGGLIDIPLPSESKGAPSTTPTGASGPLGPIGSPNTTSQDAAVTPGEPGNGRADIGTQGERDERGAEDVSSHAQDDGAASDGSSNSQAGLSPPGGGHGRSAAQEQGKPEGLPEAAGDGQQTAADNKPDHAGSPPGAGGQGGKPETPPKATGDKGPPASKPKPSPNAEDPAQPTSPPPPGEAPSSEADEATSPGKSGKAPGRER